MSNYRRFLLLLLTPLILAAQPAPQCRVELFLGDPEFSTGDGGPALNAKFVGLGGIAAADDGTIYLADRLAHQIRKIDPQGVITTVAGTGAPGSSGDGGPALQAQLRYPMHLHLAVDSSLYFIDDDSQRIRRIDTNGLIHTVYASPGTYIGGVFALPGGGVYFTESTPSPLPLANAVQALYRLEAGASKTKVADVPHQGVVSADSNGDLLVAGNSQVLRVDQTGGVEPVVGNGKTSFVDGAAPLNTGLNYSPNFIATSAAGDLYLGGSRSGFYVVRNGAIHKILAGESVGWLSSSAAGVFFVQYGRVLRLLPDDTAEPIAGVERSSWYQQGRLLGQSVVASPQKMLVDSQNRLYYFDVNSPVIMRTTSDGRTEIVAGGGDQPADDGVLAVDAVLGFVGDIALDGQDRLYFSVGGRHPRPSMILRVELNGTLTVLAGDAPPYKYRYLLPGIKIVDINFEMQAGPPIAVAPDGTLLFQLRLHTFRADTAGVLISGAPLPGYGFMAFDREGRLLFGRDVYTDLSAEPLRAFSGAEQAASASNGSYYALSGRRVLRRSPQGRTTDLVASDAGFQFDDGQLALNSGLVSVSAVATNKDGDLFMADPFMDRVFVIRDADVCRMERPYSANILNGASFTASVGQNGIAPGEIVSAFGDFLGGDTLAYGAPGQSSQGTWQTSVGGLEVFVNDQPAPIIFSRADQAAFVIPNEASGEINIRFRRGGLDSPTFSYAAKNASPGVFTANSSGGGQAAALNQDSSINTLSNRAAAGSVIVLYVTGAGLTNPPSQTGSLNQFPLPQLVEPVEVEINGVPTVVEFAGPAPGLISGVVQINARIPPETPAGTNIPVVVKIGGVSVRESPSGQWPTISIQ